MKLPYSEGKASTASSRKQKSCGRHSGQAQRALEAGATGRGSRRHSFLSQ